MISFIIKHVGQVFSDKQALRFDLSNGNISGQFEFHQWGTIKTCTTLPGPNNYNLEQCAVVINEAMYEKLRFFVYDERFDELIEVYQTTSNVQVIYRKICALLRRTQPQNLHESLKDMLGCKITGMARSYMLDNIHTNSNNIANQSLLHCGDLIARRMSNGGTWHYGVYFADNNVYHWCSQKSNNKNKGSFSRTSFAVFMANKQELFVEYDVIQIRSRSTKENKAQSLVQSVYNLWSNNCEHLANEICRGEGKCNQKWLGIGSIMGSDVSLTRMLYNSLVGPSTKNTVKCMNCKAWNYDELYCDVDKACTKCRRKWDIYQYEMRHREQQPEQRWVDEYGRDMQQQRNDLLKQLNGNSSSSGQTFSLDLVAPSHRLFKR